MKSPVWGTACAVWACAIWACAAAWAADPGAGDLTIHIDNVLPEGGVVRLGLYDRQNYPDDNSTPIASANITATPGETTATLHNIPPGTYAIEVFQDVNSNNKMDMTWLGLPEEPFGFSRDAVPFLSKPSFDQVKFILAAGDNVQTLHLRSMTTTSPADKARDAVRARQR